MKQVYKIHVSLPDNFANHKIVGITEPLKDCSEIVLAGYLEFPADTTQSMRAEIRIPFYDLEQGKRFRKILTEERG
ncbi:hypothetical protein KAU11_00250 [Candidatus Babeliales bacterium]|nr:hypothetical protein [Candidatus Babeliales bacterium]